MALEVANRLEELGYSSVSELQRTIETARLTWMPRVMFMLVPLFAGLAALVERRARRRYPSHLVFALHVHAAGFLARALVDGASMAVPPVWGDALVRASGLYILGYVFLAFRSAYGASPARAALDTAIVAAVYVVALVAATAVVIGAAMFGPRGLAIWAS